MTLLSIAIPAYDRPEALEYNLLRFISQIVLKYEDEVEIVVTDDATPGDRLKGVRERTSPYPFVRFIRNPENIGLERNLIRCTEPCVGEYLWIFGDDDFLETTTSLDEIMSHIRRGAHDFYIVNRTRRTMALDKVISENWMDLDLDRTFEFSGLREFCIDYGLIAVIGFISVNIFKRQPFVAIDKTPFFGTMYPQLGAMVEAFHHRPTLLIGRPLVCHRSMTVVEKRETIGTKKTEADYMSGDLDRRKGLYYSHPLARMLDRLIEVGALEPRDLLEIKELTEFRGGLLIDLLLESLRLSKSFPQRFSDADWRHSAYLLAQLPLDPARRVRADGLIA